MAKKEKKDAQALPSLALVFGYIAVKDLQRLEDRVGILARLGYPPREPVEMKRRKLQDGWEEIFLEPWALHEDIERVRTLAERPPPRQEASGN